MRKEGLAQGSGLVLLLALILLAITNYYLPVSECFAEEEEFVITTYYPSPYGSYNELTTYSNTYLATGSGKVGIGTSSPNYNLDITGALRATSNTYLATSSGNVGIGTLNPGQKLTVAGMMETTSGGLKFPDGTIQTTAVKAFYTDLAATCLRGSAGERSLSISCPTDRTLVSCDMNCTYCYGYRLSTSGGLGGMCTFTVNDIASNMRMEGCAICGK